MPLQKEEPARVYPRYIDFPDGEGNLHKVDLEAEPDYELLEEISRNPANNVYILFTRYMLFFILLCHLLWIWSNHY